MRLVLRARSFGFVLLVALGACARPAAPAAPVPPLATPQPPPRPIVTEAELDTLGEILRLEDRRAYDQLRFEAWAIATSVLVRRHTALGAGRIGNRAAMPLLIQLLNDPDPDVRADGTFALGELGDTSLVAVQALAAVAQSGTGADAVEAAAALGRLAAPAGYSTLAALLQHPSTPVPVRREALLAVARFPRQPGLLEVLLPLAADTALETRWRAVYALTRAVSDPRAVPQLLQWLNDPEPLVRALAARGLRAATADSAAMRTDAMAALSQALNDAHPQVRINAVRSLGTYRDATYLPAMARLLRTEDNNTAIATAESLGSVPAAQIDLRAVAEDDGRPIALRNAALNSLLRLDAPAALALARNWLAEPAWLHRLFAVRVLAAAHGQPVQLDLRRAATDADGRVAAVALAAVAADTVNPPYALFIQTLAHRDPYVRTAALRGLQRRAHPADLELFLQAYQQALNDTPRLAINAAVDALGELHRKGVPVERSFFLRFHRPSDPTLHRRVVQRIGPGDWGPAQPVENTSRTESYRAVAHRYWHPDSTQVRPRVRIRTAAGEIVLELLPQEAPLTVLNFLALAQRGYFNNGRWHRVVPNFVLQDGDPRGDGSGGPGYAIRDEINRLRFMRGMVGMALSGPDTGGSQFFITHAAQPHLDGGFTIFGFVAEGMDVADRVTQDDPILSIEVLP